MKGELITAKNRTDKKWFKKNIYYYVQLLHRLRSSQKRTEINEKINKIKRWVRKGRKKRVENGRDKDEKDDIKNLGAIMPKQP